MTTLTELLKDTTLPAAAALPFYTVVILPAVRAGQLDTVSKYLEAQAGLILDIAEVELPFTVVTEPSTSTMLVPSTAGDALDTLREELTTRIDEIAAPLYVGTAPILEVLKRFTTNRYLGASKVGAAVLAYAVQRYIAIQETA